MPRDYSDPKLREQARVRQKRFRQTQHDRFSRMEDALARIRDETFTIEEARRIAAAALAAGIAAGEASP